jgi:hypothetical protein
MESKKGAHFKGNSKSRSIGSPPKKESEYGPKWQPLDILKSNRTTRNSLNAYDSPLQVEVEEGRKKLKLYEILMQEQSETISDCKLKLESINRVNTLRKK